MVFQFLNNIRMTLGATVDASATQITVLDSDLPEASLFDPSKQLSLTLIGEEHLDQYEIVYATARTGTTFDVLRAQEGTQAGVWGQGTPVLAALSAGMLQGLTEVPTSADSVAYGGGDFVPAGSVEDALDEMGTALVREGAKTDYFEDTLLRVAGALFTGGTITETNLRWQAPGKEFVTDGFGGSLYTSSPQFKEQVIIPDVTVCMRCADWNQLLSLEVLLHNNAVATNNVRWTRTDFAGLPVNTWVHLNFSAQTPVISGTPTVTGTGMEKCRLGFRDKGVGTAEVDVNFVDLMEENLSYIGAFIKVTDAASFDKVQAIEQFGFRVSMIVDDEDIPADVDEQALWLYEKDGNFVYLTSSHNFKAQTVDQVRVLLQNGVRKANDADVTLQGYIYPGGYNGPLDLEPSITVRDLVLEKFKSGVGVLGSRSAAVRTYNFDGPLLVAANAAEATSYLSSNRSINIDLTALSVAELQTLFGSIILSGTFYQTTLEWQNADNLKAGTVSPARLPMIPASKLPTPIPGTNLPTPIPNANLPNPYPLAQLPVISVAKGGTQATTAAQARINLGVNDINGNINVNGGTFGSGISVKRTAVIQDTAGNLTLELNGVAQRLRILAPAAGAAPDVTFTVNGIRNFLMTKEGYLKAPQAVFAGAAYLGTNGNIVGSVWETWGYADAFNAIERQIEVRASFFANDRVSKLAYRKASEGSSGASADFRAPAGAVITGYIRESGANGQVTSLRYMYLQAYDPVRGWVGFTG